MSNNKQTIMTNNNLQLDLFDGIENKEFLEYHKTNPHLYDAFKAVAFDAMRMGFKTYGANGIFEIIRWKRAERGDGEFKINNNFAPLFARLFANEFPQHENFFRFRRSKFNKYVEEINKKKKSSYELVFNYNDSLVILNITPEESDWWTTLRAMSADGNIHEFDVHYCEDYNEVCVYVAGIHSQSIYKQSL